MLVRMKTSISSIEGWSYAGGEIIDVDAEQAAEWIRIGIAEPAADDGIETATVSAPESAVTVKRKYIKRNIGK